MPGANGGLFSFKLIRCVQGSRHSIAIGLYEQVLSTNPSSLIELIDKKSPCGVMASDGRSKIETTRKFEKTSRISEES